MRIKPQPKQGLAILTGHGKKSVVLVANNLDDLKEAFLKYHNNDLILDEKNVQRIKLELMQ
jgi:hypothetical protein